MVRKAFLLRGFGTLDIIFAGEKALLSTLSGEYDRKTDYEILRGIGLRLGQEKDWPWENLEEVFDYMLKLLGVNFQEFMK